MTRVIGKLAYEQENTTGINFSEKYSEGCSIIILVRAATLIIFLMDFVD